MIRRTLINAAGFVLLMVATVAVAQSHRPDAMLRHGFESAADGPYSDAEAARFLAQATFGPTLADIAHLRAIGYRAWIDEQFAQPVATQIPYLDWVNGIPGNDVTDGTRVEAWTINALGTPDPSRGMARPTDQLRQRMAFALSEIFVVSNKNGTLVYQPWALASWYDMLANNAFGNYRELLEDVTLHPAMGIYLTHLGNQKYNEALNIRPDENYAREVMQLFSIGLVQLNQDGTPVLVGGQPQPTYDQATVRGLAAVLTGWIWSNEGCGPGSYVCCTAATFNYCGPYNDYDRPVWRHPMQPIEAFHDNTSAKQLLIYPGVALPGGVLAPGGNAQTELTVALDNLFGHPNIGPFIARRLIQRFVTSNPTPAYVQRVAAAFANNGSGVRGDLKAMLRAILLDPEARFGQWFNAERFGKLREPLIRNTHLWRSMDAIAPSGRIVTLTPYPAIEDWYGQGPLSSPSVFNFFRPDFRAHGEISARGLDSPEFQIVSDSYMVSTANRLFSVSLCWYRTGTNYDGSCWADNFNGSRTLYLDIGRDSTLATNDPAGLIERYNLLFMSGQMSPFMRETLLTRLNAISGNNRARLRIQHALYLILNSPEYVVQK
ncbi:MAG TPA: DUF1800 domain-containing protein [Dokdonella sp.]|uniref:DUF1800 domain-containing protein n=1 Tax=Dokdonella sp. TaxID=2291710 RepID=UPI0025BFC396|nr:DUF1800 domain-containing protein [Dokdonella sp.]MBX3690831.1 DUF1800 domain-containing protein [Dokdonella sp.]HNR91277.1 DUF1800 domain-containing protein [Dokdonella sp.]